MGTKIINYTSPPLKYSELFAGRNTLPTTQPDSTRPLLLAAKYVMWFIPGLSVEVRRFTVLLWGGVRA